jgi:hypothetical protein
VPEFFDRPEILERYELARLTSRNTKAWNATMLEPYYGLLFHAAQEINSHIPVLQKNGLKKPEYPSNSWK